MNRFDSPQHSFTWFSDFRMHSVRIGPDTDVLTFPEDRPIEIRWSGDSEKERTLQLTSVYAVRVRISPTDTNAGVFCQMDIDAHSRTLVFTIPIRDMVLYCVEREGRPILYWEKKNAQK